MPMPSSGQEWPPKNLECYHRDVTIWSAWWSSDPERLSHVYGGGYTPTERSFSQQSWTQRGGLVGAVQRFFWGQPTTPGQQRNKLHVPLAGEIPQVSADLLFGQPPTITIPGSEDEPVKAGDDKPSSKADPAAKTTQERIDQLLGEPAHTMFHEAAEAAAALGHVYLRAAWDRDVDPTGPIPVAVDADAAFPLYRYGRLTQVTFVREWSDAGGVLRHLEHHEPGMIWHAAYLGDRHNLGRPVDLGAHAETRDLMQDEMVADDAYAGSGVRTGIDRLDVVGISNARSNTWRNLPTARDLGRADICGVEPTLDALDDVWSSWMRDIRHGRSRLHVPSHMLESRGPGQGAIADIDKELYVGLTAPPDGQLQLTATQFAIRFQEHAATAEALTEAVVSGAGYSPQTFGMNADSALTATEAWSRQMRTQGTRNGKIRRWRQGLTDFTQLMIAVDRAQFNGKGNPDLVPEVQFAETVSESQLARAQTAQALRNARAASTDTLVRLQHHDWDEEKIQEEVTKIEGEDQAANGTFPDPMSMFSPGESPKPGGAAANGAAPGTAQGRMDDLDWGLFGS